MPKPKTEDDKNSLLDDLENLDQDPPKDDDKTGTDDPPPADDDKTGTDDDPPADDPPSDEPPPNVVDMFVNGDTDAVKQAIQDKVVSAVSAVVNGPVDNADDPPPADDDPPPAED